MTNIIKDNREKLEKYHYIRKAGGKDYWCDVSEGKLNRYIKLFGDNFSLIIYGDMNEPSDFFAIPWEYGKKLFIKKGKDSSRNRWIFNIYNKPNDTFLLKISNIPNHFDVTKYYSSTNNIPQLLDNGYILKNQGGLESGEIISNNTLCDIFKCGVDGEMRCSYTTNTLVLISDHTKSICEDRWIGEIFYYTVSDFEEDKNINISQNKTLAQSQSNGINVHLFEVFEKCKYFYQGMVKLVDEPYEECQLDQNGHIRNIIVYPLKLSSGVKPPAIDEDVVWEAKREIQFKVENLTDADLERFAKSSLMGVGNREVKRIIYERSSYVAELAKRRAKGMCQLCNRAAPFSNSGKPYLETHHIKWLSRGGTDTPENTVALCPNCHRKMHVLDLDEDKNKLKLLGGFK